MSHLRHTHHNRLLEHRGLDVRISLPSLNRTGNSRNSVTTRGRQRRPDYLSVLEAPLPFTCQGVADQGNRPSLRA